MDWAVPATVRTPGRPAVEFFPHRIDRLDSDYGRAGTNQQARALPGASAEIDDGLAGTQLELSAEPVQQFVRILRTAAPLSMGCL